MDTDSFLVHVKIQDISEDITKDIGKMKDLFHTEKKKVIGLIKDELNGKIMKKFMGLRVKQKAIQQVTMVEVKRQKVQKMCNNTKT